MCLSSTRFAEIYILINDAITMVKLLFMIYNTIFIILAYLEALHLTLFFYEWEKNKWQKIENKFKIFFDRRHPAGLLNKKKIEVAFHSAALRFFS